MVPRRGLEPPRPCDHYDLNVARLPVPPPGHFGKSGGLILTRGLGIVNAGWGGRGAWDAADWILHEEARHNARGVRSEGASGAFLLELVFARTNQSL